MPLAEQLSTISADYQSALIRARRFPPVGVRRSTGRKRDRAIAKANREYYAALTNLGIRTRRRGGR